MLRSLGPALAREGPGPLSEVSWIRASACACGGVRRLKRTRSSGRSCPNFQSSALASVAGHTNPPNEGPSGPRMTGMSPVKSTAPMAYALSWMFEGCSPASPPSLRAHSGFGPDEPHARATRVVMNRPSGAEKSVDIGIREKVGRTMGSVEHAELPLAPDRRNRLQGNRRWFAKTGPFIKVQYIARRQRPAAVPAELAQGKRRSAAHVGRYLNTATNGEISPAAGLTRGRQPQASTRL